MSSDVNAANQNNAQGAQEDSGGAAQPSVHAASDGGITASHAPVATFPALVGPATADEFNTLRTAIIPIACFRLDDVRFAFGLSFVLPEAAQELDGLAALIAQHVDAGLPTARQHPPLSVFGHADPVGRDEDNKILSGRRAEAIYGLLTRKTALWERLYSQPVRSDKWGLQAVQTMLDTLLFDPGRQDGVMDTPTQDAIKAFQKANGLAPNGQADTPTRKALFKAYMDALCRRDVANAGGQPFVVAPEQFLGAGADAGGKGDYQGCSEFNPMQVFSQAEETRYAAAQDKTERNAANASNRRVLIFLFRPGTQIETDKWPCPRAEEGTAGCRKRFWSDAALRRAPGPTSRKYEDTQDTFACRFYDRLADASPCEIVRGLLRIYLLDNDGRHMPIGTAYRLTMGAQVRKGALRQPALLQESNLILSDHAFIEWGEPLAGEGGQRDPADDRLRKAVLPANIQNHPFLEGTPPVTGLKDVFRYRAKVLLDYDPADVDGEVHIRRRLHNYRYPLKNSIDENLRIFEFDFALSPEDPENRRTTLRDYHVEGTQMPLAPDYPPFEGDPGDVECSNTPI